MEVSPRGTACQTETCRMLKNKPIELGQVRDNGESGLLDEPTSSLELQVSRCLLS